MTQVVLDSNVLISAVLVRASINSPPRALLEAVFARRLPMLLSTALITEYSEVLRRPEITALHGLAAKDVDLLLAKIASCGRTCEPAPAPLTPSDLRDQHIVDLTCSSDSVWLVTGDKPLLQLAAAGLRVMTLRDALRLLWDLS